MLKEVEPLAWFIVLGGWIPIALLLYALLRALPEIEEGQNWFVAISDPIARFFRWPWFTVLCPLLIVTIWMIAMVAPEIALAAFFFFFLPITLGPFFVLYSGFEGQRRLKSRWPLIIASLIALPWTYLVLRIHIPILQD